MSSAQATVTGVSLEQFLRMPGNEHMTWTEGEVAPVAENTTDHGYLVMQLGAPLHEHVRRHRLGVVLSESVHFFVTLPDGERATRKPDLSFIATDQPEQIRKTSPIERAPDLAVEVVSEHDRHGEVNDKVDLWLANGAQRVWVLDHGARVIVHRPDHTARILGADDHLDGEHLLPGFSLRVAELYE